MSGAGGIAMQISSKLYILRIHFAWPTNGRGSGRPRLHGQREYVSPLKWMKSATLGCGAYGTGVSRTYELIAYFLSQTPPLTIIEIGRWSPRSPIPSDPIRSDTSERVLLEPISSTHAYATLCLHVLVTRPLLAMREYNPILAASPSPGLTRRLHACEISVFGRKLTSPADRVPKLDRPSATHPDRHQIVDQHSG